MPSDNSLAGGFDVFISYSRQDMLFARMLGKHLANYTPPKGLGLPARRLKVFRDEVDIKGADYFQSIEEFLRRSSKLVLICSPSSRKSPFVNDEVRRFIEARGIASIVPILLCGIPNNEAKPGQEDQLAFPDALCEAMEMPLAVPYRDFDVRTDKPHKGVYYTSWYTTLANIYDVSRAEIEQRDKNRRTRNRAIAAGLMTGIIAVLTVALIVTVQARNNARAQRDIATNALQRASARLLTLQARDEAKQSFPRALLLSAAAVEATASQNYVEPATEQFLRDALSQARGGPMVAPVDGERPMLYDISPDKFWAMTSGPGKHPTLWRFGQTGQVEEKIPLDAVQYHDVLEFSPNSKFVIWADSPLTAGAGGGHVTLIPLSSASRRATYARMAIPARSENIKEIHFSPNGRLALVQMDYPEDKPIHLYQIADDGSTIKEMRVSLPKEERNPPEQWQFSPDGSWLVALQKRNESLAWRLGDDGIAGPYVLKSASESGDRFADFSGNRKWLVTYGYSSTAKLWSLTGDLQTPVGFDLATDRAGSVEEVRYSPDGKWLLASPCLWRLDAPTPSSTPICLPMPRRFTSEDVLDFTKDSRRLVVSGHADGSRYWVWDLTAADPAATPLALTGSFEISADRRWSVEMTAGRPAIVRDLRDGPVNASGGVDLAGPPVLRAAFAHNSVTLATVHADGSIRMHSLESQSRIRTTVAREAGIPPNRLQFSSKDGWLLAQCYSRWPGFVRRDLPALFRIDQAAPVMIRLDDSTFEFEMRDGKDVKIGQPSDTEFEFSPEEDRLIGSQTLSSIGYVWDLRSTRIDESRQLLKGHESRISFFDFVAGGTLITSELYDSIGAGPYRKYPRLWEPGGRSAKHPDAFVRWTSFNRKGDALAAIGDEGTLVLYRPREDGTLEAALTAADLGGGVINRRPVGAYAIPTRLQFSPAFDETGRWLLSASAAGQLYAIDCSPASPKVHKIGVESGEQLFVAVNPAGSLLATGADGHANEIDVWDLSGTAPVRKGRLNVDWAADFYSSDPPEITVAFPAADRIAISAPGKAPGRSEVWGYALPAGARTQMAEVARDVTTSAARDGSVVAGSQGAYDLRKQVAHILDGFLPDPSAKESSPTESRFEYCISPDGRWAVGRRYTIEGYPEFGRRSSYAWRHIFDLESRDPSHAVVTLPDIERAIFADFSGDSRHWVSVSKEGIVTIVSLPPKSVPQITSKSINQYFSGRALGVPFWPTGELSYEVSLSPGGDWLATQRADFMYLIRLQAPFDGKLLRGFEAERGLSSVTTSFSPNEDLAMIGRRFWRARADADLLWPVTLGEEILTASVDGKWIATASGSNISLHPLDVMQLVRRARSLAGRDLTDDEKEQFLLRRLVFVK